MSVRIPITTSTATSTTMIDLEKLVPTAPGLIAEEAVHLADTGELDIDMTLPVREA